MGLHWAFIAAAIFGVFDIVVPVARAQQQSTTVDDQGPIIGMMIVSPSREAWVDAFVSFSRHVALLQALILGLPTHA